MFRKWLYLLLITLGLCSLGLKAYADARYGGISTRCLVKTNAEDYMYAGFQISGGAKTVTLGAYTISQIAGNNFLPRIEVKTFPDATLIYSDNNPNAKPSISTTLTLTEGWYTVTVSPVAQDGIGIVYVNEVDDTGAILASISTRCYVGTAAQDAMIAGVEVKGGEQCTDVQGLGIAEITGNNFKPALKLQTFPDNIHFSTAKDIYQATNAERKNKVKQSKKLAQGPYTAMITPSGGIEGIGQVAVTAMDLASCSDTTTTGGTTNPTNSSCGVVTTSCPDLNTMTPPSGNLVAWLGASLDSSREWLKQEDCLGGTSELIGTSQATFSSSLFTSYKDVLEIEKKSAGGKLSVKFFSAHANAKYEKMFRQTSYAQSYMLRYDVDLGTKRFKISSLSDRGIQAANGGACSFQRYCGNKYVSQVTQGGSVEVGLNFKFKTTSQKREFEAGGGFGFEGEICCVPVSAQLKASVGRLSSKTKKESFIEIVAYQEGGRVEDLINIFGTQNNTTECALDNLDACLRVVDDVIAYIKSGFAPTLRDNPTTTAYEYASYDSVIGVPNLAIEVTPEIEQAREELAEKYEESFEALNKVNELLQYSLEPSRQQKMQQLQDALIRDIENIDKAAKTCFSDLSQCLVQKCAVMDSLADYTLEELEIRRDDGLLLYLPFELNAEDSSWHKNHGVVTGNLTYVSDGILGTAANFDGATYIGIPNTEAFKSSDSSFTFSVWIDVKDNPNVYRGYISLFDSFNNRIELAKYRYKAGSNIYMHVYQDATYAVSQETGINKGWLHLVGVIDRASKTLTLYINGTEKAFNNQLIEFSLSNPSLSIGSCLIGTCRHYGRMDEVRIWERALSEQEIVQLYDEGKQ